MKRIWLFIYLVGGLALLFCGCKTAKLSVAEEKQRIGEYYEAAAIYRRVYAKTKPQLRERRAYIAFRMAECNRLINNMPRATTGYMNALRYHYPDSIVYLRLGQVYQKQGKYGDALKYYDEYLTSYPENQLALTGKAGSEMAVDMKRNPSLYIVRRMDRFNSTKGEFSPMLTGSAFDQLYFTSSRVIKGQESPTSAITGQNTNDFYVIKKDGNGLWLQPDSLEGDLNTEFDEGTPSFTSDGNTMYYTYCARDPESFISRPAEIYRSTRSNAQWSKGEKVFVLHDSVTTVAHPAVSPDGQYLYFVSDMGGGYGGKDLFRCRIESGNSFGPVENMGNAINTTGDELFPYVRDSVTLYFASDGHPGMGGLDLFKAVMDSAGKWTVRNMGAPINSAEDDFGITFAGSKDEGFISSNRGDNRGYDHLYSFSYPAVNIFIEGVVMNVNEEPVENAQVRIVGRDGLNVRAPVKRDGSYRVEIARDIHYVMLAGASGYLNQNFELTTLPEERNETYTVDFYLTPISQPVVVADIFYDFDKAILRPESKQALDDLIKVLNDNPNVTIELGAHTDRKGSVVYNERLAQRRAQAVVSYLIKGGIHTDRLQAKGYGKNVPVTINKRQAEQYPFLHEGDILTEAFILNLTPEQQVIADQINRRTEFKVLRTNYNSLF